MKRLMITGLAAVALFAAVATMMRSHALPTDRPVGDKDKTSLRHTSADVNKLPIEEFEDMSLVFSSVPKR